MSAAGSPGVVSLGGPQADSLAVQSVAKPLPLVRTRIPRALHPVAWWLWAIGLAVAASRTSNPLLLVLIVCVAGFVVSMRRTNAPWALGFRYYLWMALVIIVIRVVFRSIFPAPVLAGDPVLLHLPHIPTPSWYAGIRIGGDVSFGAVISAIADGLRLATLLCCIGAANVLANPKRMLRVLPGALHEIGVALVVSISIAPQLIESTQRVRKARRLRGGGKGLRALKAIFVPVLEDALANSRQLAASMDSRGYGRSATAKQRDRIVTAVLMISALIALCVGSYGLLGGGLTSTLGYPGLVVGTVLGIAGLFWGGRRVTVTTYRPDPWLLAEWGTVACGIVCAAVFLFGYGYAAEALVPSFEPPAWPTLPVVPLAAILVAAIPAFITPPAIREEERR